MAGSFFVQKFKKCVRYPRFFMVQSKRKEKNERRKERTKERTKEKKKAKREEKSREKREREIISLAGY